MCVCMHKHTSDPAGFEKIDPKPREMNLKRRNTCVINMMINHDCFHSFIPKNSLEAVLDAFILLDSTSRCVSRCEFSEHIELPAKLLDYFLRSNKSNINQYTHTLNPSGFFQNRSHTKGIKAERWKWLYNSCDVCMWMHTDNLRIQLDLSK